MKKNHTLVIKKVVIIEFYLPRSRKPSLALGSSLDSDSLV
ncbi:unnamed protein product [Arabidopsis halleri]